MTRTTSVEVVSMPFRDGRPGGEVTVRLPPGVSVFDPQSGEPNFLQFAWGPDWFVNPPEVTHTLRVVPEGKRAQGRRAGSFEWRGELFALFHQESVSAS